MRKQTDKGREIFENHYSRIDTPLIEILNQQFLLQLKLLLPSYIFLNKH